MSTRIPRELIDEIRERTDLVELVKRHVRLQRRGNSFVGLCPFHQEKSPSFHVIPHKHLYHCFGCQAGGDCFRFLQEMEGVSFMEAVRELAGAAGVAVEDRELSEEERQRIRQRASLYELNEHVCRLWGRALWMSAEGDAARKYLVSRGLTRETVREWQIGYAPAGWTTTSDKLARDGFSAPLLVEAGLIKPRTNGSGYYDTFRDRIILPICDERGRVIAFGARLLQGEGPKYLNSPETTLYHKGRVLFGLNHARKAIQERDRALLVEGYFDVISLHQAGFRETIATCGTAMTEDHLTTIKRLSGKVVALFDADEAGARAAERALPLFVRAGVQPYRLELPGAKDPDELVREQGAPAMEAALSSGQDLLEWVVERRVTRIMREGNSSVARDQLVDELVELLAWTEGTDIVGRAAQRLRIGVESLLQRVSVARAQRGAQRPASPDPVELTSPATSPWRPSRDIVHLVWLLIHHPDAVLHLASCAAPWAWEDQGVAAPLITRLVSGQPVAAVLAEVDDEKLLSVFRKIALRADLYTEAQAERGMAQVLQRIAEGRLDRDLSALSSDAQRALREGDLDRQELATRAWTELRGVKARMEGALRASNLENLKVELRALQAIGQVGEAPWQ